MPNESIFSAICRRGKVALLSAILLTTLICSGCDKGPLFSDDSDKKTDIIATENTSKTSDKPEPKSSDEPKRVKMNEAEVYEKFGSCAVSIEARDGNNKSLGSGVIFTDDGYIITNDHVIRGKTSSMEVHLLPDRMLKAKLIATDPRMDLAVLKVEGDNLQAIKFGNSDEMKTGSVVFAIGNPYGLEGSSTPGSISKLNVDVPEEMTIIRCLQVNAALNPGNSGGALLNEYGELVGINVASVTNSDNIGFAIPSNDVKRIAEQLKDNKEVPYCYLGVYATNETNKKGMPFILVRAVKKDSPAAKAGFQEGDIILRVGDKRVENVPKLREETKDLDKGTEVAIYTLRDNQEGFIYVTLDKIPKGYDPIDWS